MQHIQSGACEEHETLKRNLGWHRTGGASFSRLLRHTTRKRIGSVFSITRIPHGPPAPKPTRGGAWL